MVELRAVLSPRPSRFGRNPSSLIASRTLWVAGECGGARPLTTRLTVATETSARAATVRIVGGVLTELMGSQSHVGGTSTPPLSEPRDRVT